MLWIEVVLKLMSLQLWSFYYEFWPKLYRNAAKKMTLCFRGQKIIQSTLFWIYKNKNHLFGRTTLVCRYDVILFIEYHFDCEKSAKPSQNCFGLNIWLEQYRWKRNKHVAHVKNATMFFYDKIWKLDAKELYPAKQKTIIINFQNIENRRSLFEGFYDQYRLGWTCFDTYGRHLET